LGDLKYLESTQPAPQHQDCDGLPLVTKQTFAPLTNVWLNPTQSSR